MHVDAPRVIEKVDDTEVSITRQPGKPLALLLRMASREMGVWDYAWDALCRYFSVAQFDLKMPPAEALKDPGAAFAALAEQSVRVAERLGYSDFHVIGWTGGAHIALRCALDHGDRIRSITLLSPFYPLATQIAEAITTRSKSPRPAARKFYSCRPTLDVRYRRKHINMKSWHPTLAWVIQQPTTTERRKNLRQIRTSL